MAKRTGEMYPGFDLLAKSNSNRTLAVRPAGTGKANSTPREVRRHNRRVRRYRRKQYGPSPYVSGHSKVQA